jgi:hypothetical protein
MYSFTILNLGAIIGVNGCLHYEATLPQGKIPGTVAGVDILCRRVS